MIKINFTVDAIIKLILEFLWSFGVRQWPRDIFNRTKMEEIGLAEEVMEGEMEEIEFVDVKEEIDDITDNKARNDKVYGAEESEWEEVR